jgi:hypothetical protein
MDLHAQAAMFRMQRPFEEVPADWNLLKGMKCAKANVPIFTYLNDTNARCLAQTDDFVLYLNAATPYVELYPDKPDRAGMSFAHFLVVPRERIYNAATLRREDAQLVRVMREKVTAWMNDPEFRKRVGVEMAILYTPMLTTKEIREKFAYQLDRFVYDVDGSYMQFFFHVHPEHSVGHLHMHSLAMDRELLTPSYELNSDRNTPADEVLKKYCK